MFKALHQSLTIRPSDIHGLGVFAAADIPARTLLGISHVATWDSVWARDHHFPHGYIRTPIGGLINHSANPNCTKVNLIQPLEITLGFLNTWPTPYYSSLQGTETTQMMGIATLRKIIADEELTVTYTIYSLKGGEPRD